MQEQAKTDPVDKRECPSVNGVIIAMQCTTGRSTCVDALASGSHALQRTAARVICMHTVNVAGAGKVKRRSRLRQAKSNAPRMVVPYAACRGQWTSKVTA